MPGFDGTGPRGMGPMTGGGRGFCNPNFAGMGAPYMGNPYARNYGQGAPYPGPGDPCRAYTYTPYGGFGMGRGFGRGRGMKRGMGRGRGFGW